MLEFVTNVFVEPDNKVLVVGFQQPGTVADGTFVVARFTASGVLDTSFGGGDGQVTLDFVASGVRTAADGKIMVVGNGPSTDNTQDVFTAARLNANGTFDASYGTNGVSVTNVRVGTTPVRVALQPDGKLLFSSDVFDRARPGRPQQRRRHRPAR